MVLVGHSLLECTEMADHFRAFRYVTTRLDAAFDEYKYSPNWFKWGLR